MEEIVWYHYIKYGQNVTGNSLLCKMLCLVKGPAQHDMIAGCPLFWGHYLRNRKGFCDGVFSGI